MTDITFDQVMERANAEGERIATTGFTTKRATTDEPLAGLSVAENERWTLDIDRRDGEVSVRQWLCGGDGDSVPRYVWEGHVTQFALSPATSTTALIRLLKESPEAIARYAVSDDVDERYELSLELDAVLGDLDSYWMMDPQEWFHGHGLTGRETDAEIEDLTASLVAQDEEAPFLWAAFVEDEARAWLKERVSELACA